MKELDLSWGNPYFLLEILDQQMIHYKKAVDFKNMSYEADNGNPELLKKVAQITEETTGNKYKHYIITNGATQALNTVMRVWERDRELIQVTTTEFGYPYYPEMIDKTMTMVHKRADLKAYNVHPEEMVIVDSPSNPLGQQYGGSIYVKDQQNIVWDAVYHNPIYAASKLVQPNHEVHINSFSKLLGVTGARVGWIATNDDHDFKRFSEESLYENATVSKPSQQLVLDILNTLDIHRFMTNGRVELDSNRDVMQGLSSLIGTYVPDKGMFYCAQADKKLFELFDKAKVKYVKMRSEDREYIRLNLGQTRDTILRAVTRINKIDKGGK